ncbi:MAG: NUDIX hydrolase [Tuberibacillus sp.]
MESEKLKVFDRNRKQIGVATREDVHKKGLWHETFHCWFLSREDGHIYIYLQLRSADKKDYPNLLDITAAGHLLADETVSDGLREVEEELGFKLEQEALTSLGVIEHSLRQEDFIDNEFCHVFLYYREDPISGFNLQKEEVSGMMKAEFQSFCDLWQGKSEEIRISGFLVNKDGKEEKVSKSVGKEQFIPGTDAYYKTLIERFQEYLQ